MFNQIEIHTHVRFYKARPAGLHPLNQKAPDIDWLWGKKLKAVS